MQRVFMGMLVTLLCIIQLMGCAAQSPEEQAKELKVVAKQGVTWQTVADDFKEPRKWMRVNYDSPSGYTSEIKFDRTQFESQMKAGRMADGFAFRYAFHVDHVFVVRFTAAGVVDEIQEPITPGDFLDGDPFN